MKRSSPRIVGPDKEGWYSLRREVNAASARALARYGPIDKLSASAPLVITSRSAQRLRALPSVRWLWLWCDVTRAAMNRLIVMPGLEMVDVLTINGKGRLSGFVNAKGLHTLRANCALRARDVIAIADCAGLRELGIQRAELSTKALDALCAMPALERLDLEATRFDDGMVERLCESTSLNWLELGATGLTRRGLQYLTRMRQLRGLDLWATPLAIKDFELLREFPALEYVSLGGYIDASLDGEVLVPMLLSLPALKRIWLDGVKLDREQRAALEGRFKDLRIN